MYFLFIVLIVFSFQGFSSTNPDFKPFQDPKFFDWRNPSSLEQSLDKLKIAMAQLKGSSNKIVLVLGVSPYEDHPLFTANLKGIEIFTLNERLPNVPAELQKKYEAHFFHLDFNSKEFQEFAKAAQGFFQSVYFDWSTFKFARPKDCLQEIYALLPKGGRLIIPQPVSMIYALLNPDEEENDFWKLPMSEKRTRNLFAIVSTLEKIGFSVEITNSSNLFYDPVFQEIEKNVHYKEGKPSPFQVLIAIKK